MKRALSPWLAALLIGTAGCQSGAPPRGGPGATGQAAEPSSLSPAPAPVLLPVPATSARFELDGELDEEAWTSSARTGPFLGPEGGEARPFSEARFLLRGDEVMMALYAADDDIEARVKAHDGPVWLDDSFSVHLTPVSGRDGAPGTTFQIDVSALGTVSDARVEGAAKDARWESALRLGVDRDGTLGDRSDEDEEWVVEAALPLAPLGIHAAPGARLGVQITRCDTPRAPGSTQRCGATAPGLTLDLSPPEHP
ncbi:MAG: carbohydrate-binding family 9-like protein [Byssovorax sp.]